MSKSINIEGYLISSTKVGVNEFQLSIFQNEKFAQNFNLEVEEVAQFRFQRLFGRAKEGQSA